jgi:glutaminyl-tRNA synthetase
VRLRWGFFITCTGVVKDESGNVTEVRCTYDPATRGGGSPDGRKVKSTIHWVAADHALDAEVRIYQTLFATESPSDLTDLNPDSLEVLTGCKIEPALRGAKTLDRYQFERLGYFCVDPDSRPDTLVFNRTVALKDTWAKIEKRAK